MNRPIHCMESKSASRMIKIILLFMMKTDNKRIANDSLKVTISPIQERAWHSADIFTATHTILLLIGFS
ncbi:MAG TPA: hypothetical protein DCS49_01650 [Gammaproteobacteria bacterium]|nr:hypothetical protein [Gammaproteobacteria bacterium]